MVTLDSVHKFWNKKYRYLIKEDILFGPNKYSEHGEDNVIECVFPDPIGGQYAGYFVDVGANGPRSSNTYTLIDRSWSGLLIEASDIQFPEIEEKANSLENVYAIHEYVKPDSLEKILGHYKVEKNFDFLSIDVDSFEYEIWKNLKEYQPNLVCIEVNQLEKNWKKIDYDPSYSLNKYRGQPESYGGATIGLMNRLAEEKGYDYLCWDVSNAFYVKKDWIKKRHY